MATTTRSGQNVGAALTRLHLLEEKVRHLDPNAEPPDGPDLEDVLARLTAAEALLQRYWETLFEAAAVEYKEVGLSLTPADTVVFDDNYGGLVRALFGTGGHGMASARLIAARAPGDSLAEQIVDLRFRMDNAETMLANHPSRISAMETTLANHASRISAMETTLANHAIRISALESAL